MNKQGTAHRKSITPSVQPPMRADTRDMETLIKDREAMQQLVTSILSNERLASMIAYEWMEKHEMMMAPAKWFEELRLAKSLMKELLQ